MYWRFLQKLCKCIYIWLLLFERQYYVDSQLSHIPFKLRSIIKLKYLWLLKHATLFNITSNINAKPFSFLVLSTTWKESLKSGLIFCINPHNHCYGGLYGIYNFHHRKLFFPYINAENIKYLIILSRILQ